MSVDRTRNKVRTCKAKTAVKPRSLYARGRRRLIMPTTGTKEEGEEEGEEEEEAAGEEFEHELGVFACWEFEQYGERVSVMVSSSPSWEKGSSLWWPEGEGGGRGRGA